MAEKVGSVSTHSSAILPLDPAPNMELVRESIQRLRNPERRLIEEFFWLWPLEREGQNGHSVDSLLTGDIESALQTWAKNANDTHDPVSIHNLAVISHTLALDLEHKGVLTESEGNQRDLNWQSAYRNWTDLLNHEDFWTMFSERIRALDDPRLTTGVGRRIRDSLPLALLLINARLAVEFAEEQSSVEVIRQVHIIQDSRFGSSEIEEALRRSISPLFERIKSLCKAAQQQADLDPVNAHEVARRLLEQSREPLRVVSGVLPSSNSTCNDIRDEVALTSLSCEVSYGNKTEDWDTAVELGELSLEIAASVPAKSRIQANLKTLKENVSGRELGKLLETVRSLTNSSDSPEKKFAAMKELTSKLRLPSFWNKLVIDDESKTIAMNLCAQAFRSLAIDLHNDRDQFGLAYEAIVLASRYCLDPELSVQISKDTVILKEHAGLSGQVNVPRSASFRYSSAPQAPRAQTTHVPRQLRDFLSWRVLVGAIIAVVVGLNILWLANSPTPSNQNSQIKNENSQSLVPSSDANLNTKSGASPRSSLLNENRTRPVATPDSQSVNMQPSERSTSSDAQINQLRDEIEDAKARLETMKQEISSLESELENYKSRIDANAATIERMEANSRMGLDVDTVRYKRLIAEHNSDVEEHNSILRTYREKLALHNGLLEATNEKVRQYNILVRSR